MSVKKCGDDQEALRLKVQEWSSKEGSKFYYQTHREILQEDGTTKEVPFMYVHQEAWQQRLLIRYGSEVAFMDATYKTCKYAIPLFFVCVQTNIGYKVVAQFMCQHEDQASVSAALKILKMWNPKWQPKYFVVDYSTVEIGALEEQFEDIVVYICDFHRVQAMKRWAKSGKHGLSPVEQDIFLKHMQKITHSPSQAAFDKSVATLRASSLYKFKANVKNYVEKTWLSCSYRWVLFYRRKKEIKIATTNNGVEAQNRRFKYDHLPRSVDKSVYGIATILTESFLPDSFQHYVDTNVKLSSHYRRYSSNVPAFLHNRPPLFVKHCLKSIYEAAADIGKEDAAQEIEREKGIFTVKSQTHSKVQYEVDFTVPCCTCESWITSRFLCKHFFIVFNNFQEWGFYSLPARYLNNAMITLDDCVVPKPITNESLHEDYEQSNCDFSSEELPMELETANDENSKTTGKLSPSADNLKRKVLEQLEGLKNTVFLVQDTKVLEDAVAQLQQVHASMKHACPTLNGIPLRSSPAKKRLKETSVQYHQIFHKKLPLRR